MQLFCPARLAGDAVLPRKAAQRNRIRRAVQHAVGFARKLGRRQAGDTLLCMDRVAYKRGRFNDLHAFVNV